MFYGMVLLARHPTPYMEDHGISLCLGHHLWHVWHEWLPVAMLLPA